MDYCANHALVMNDPLLGYLAYAGCHDVRVIIGVGGRARFAAWCALVAIGVGPLAGCSLFRSSEPDCPAARSSDFGVSGKVGPIEPVDEALWVADGSGTLRAFDGRTNRV